MHSDHPGLPSHSGHIFMRRLTKFDPVTYYMLIIILIYSGNISEILSDIPGRLSGRASLIPVKSNLLTKCFSSVDTLGSGPARSATSPREFIANFPGHDTGTLPSVLKSGLNGHLVNMMCRILYGEI